MSSMPTSTATTAGLQPAPRSIHHLLQCPRASLRTPHPGRPRPPAPRRGVTGPASLLLHPTNITKGGGRVAAAGHRLRQRLAGGVHEAARPHPFRRAAAPVPGVSLCRCRLLGPAGGHHHGLRTRTAHGQSLPDHHGRAGAPAQVGGTHTECWTCGVPPAQALCCVFLGAPAANHTLRHTGVHGTAACVRFEAVFDSPHINWTRPDDPAGLTAHLVGSRPVGGRWWLAKQTGS